MADLRLFVVRDFRSDKNTPVTLMGDKTGHYLSVSENGSIIDHLTTPFPDTTSIFGIDLIPPNTGNTGSTGSTGSTGNTGSTGGTGDTTSNYISTIHISDSNFGTGGMGYVPQQATVQDGYTNFYNQFQYTFDTYDTSSFPNPEYLILHTPRMYYGDIQSYVLIGLDILSLNNCKFTNLHPEDFIYISASATRPYRDYYMPDGVSDYNDGLFYDLMTTKRNHLNAASISRIFNTNNVKFQMGPEFGFTYAKYEPDQDLTKDQDYKAYIQSRNLEFGRVGVAIFTLHKNYSFNINDFVMTDASVQYNCLSNPSLSVTRQLTPIHLWQR